MRGDEVRERTETLVRWGERGRAEVGTAFRSRARNHGQNCTNGKMSPDNVQLSSGGKAYYQNPCQSRFSGVYLVFKVFQETDFKEFPISFYRCASRFWCFRQKWRTSAFALFS